MMHEVTHAQKWNPLSDWIKFCRVVDIPDVITYANFGEDRLGGLWLTGGQSLHFSNDFDHRPYNTLALPVPCECGILYATRRPASAKRTARRLGAT